MSIHKYGFLVILLASNISFAMHMAIFRGAQVLGAGYCIKKGMDNAINLNREYKKSVEGELVQEEEVIQWVQEKVQKYDVPQIPFMYGSLDWSVESDKVLQCSRGTAKQLDHALCSKLRMEEALATFQRTRTAFEKDVAYRKGLMSWQRLFSEVPDHSEQEFAQLDEGIAAAKILIKEFSDKIDLNEIFFLHEMGHRYYQDTKRKMYILALMPIGIQAVCSSITYDFNKRFRIKPPKTVLRAMLLRAPLALAAVPLKIALYGIGLIAYCRYREAQADRFSCEKYNEYTQSGRGLEVAREFWLNEALIYEGHITDHLKTKYPDKVFSQGIIGLLAFIDHAKKDVVHPYPRTRAQIYEDAIDKRNKKYLKEVTE